MLDKKLKIALTGGGTAGHVMPHLALIPEFHSRGWNYFYIGSRGMEADLIRPTGMRFHTISSGKLRRYYSWQNFTDVIRVAWGFFQSLWILCRERPDVVFSKGGFVSVPVCFAAFCLRIPVVTHESDLTPGLATRLIARGAKKILYSFPETGRYLPSKRSQCVGAIVRQDLRQGSKEEGLRICRFSSTDPRPVLLIMGGSLGAQRLNETVMRCFDELVAAYRIVHLTGRGKGTEIDCPDYCQFEFAGEELKHLYAAADLVLARAGANSIFEFLTVYKPMLLIPLESGSRGDQLLNARSFATHGWGMLLREAELSQSTLMGSLGVLYANRDVIVEKMREYHDGREHASVVDVIAASAL